jgi:hypothetical protein
MSNSYIFQGLIKQRSCEVRISHRREERKGISEPWRQVGRSTSSEVYRKTGIEFGHK